MNLKPTFIFCICLSILMIVTNACTIEKRVYQKGFHISWKHKNVQISNHNEILETDIKESETTIQENIDSIIETKNLASDISLKKDDDYNTSFKHEVTSIEEKTTYPSTSNPVKKMMRKRRQKTILNLSHLVLLRIF